MLTIAKRPCLLVVLALCAGSCLHAQDTLRLTLPEAENILIQKNSALLAKRYNIEIAKAQAMQARLYNNPNVQLVGSFYNPEQKKFLDLGRTGEYIISVQQLITVAGKRNKQVKLAGTNTAMRENEFFDLLRTLRFSLHSDFYQLYFLQRSIDAYATQIGYLEKLNAAYQDLLSRGTVSLKDAVRIKSLLYSLKAEQTTLQNQVNDVNAELQILLQNNKMTLLAVASKLPSAELIDKYNLTALIDTAYRNRFDLKLAENGLLYNRQNWVLQKALARPDLTLGAQFDKRGSFVNNASFLTLAMDLPFFNRNQGNIKAARVSIDQAQTLLDQQRLTVENEVQTAYIKLMNTNKVLRSFDPAFQSQLEKLLSGVTENFQKKNIGLLEFTDFYETYKNNMLQLNQLENQRMQAIETLAFAIGRPIY